VVLAEVVAAKVVELEVVATAAPGVTPDRVSDTHSRITYMHT
jgi:hypothetical protein